MLKTNEGYGAKPSHPNLHWGSVDHLKQVRPGHWRSIRELIAYYKKQGKIFPQITSTIYAFQLFKALSFLRLKDLAAGTLSSKNVIVSIESQILVVCLGNGCDGSSENWYFSPETLSNLTKQSHASDVWAAACIVAEMYAVKPIFQKLLAQSPTFIAETAFSVSDYLPETLPAELGQLLKSCLKYKPGSRISATNAMFDPYFEKILNKNIKINGKEVVGITNFTPLEGACYEDYLKSF